MNIVQEVANGLGMRPNELERESLWTFLEKRIIQLEGELFLLAKKYGVKNVFELDHLIKKGRFREENTFEDYFKFDKLQAEIKRLKKYLEKVK